MRLVLVMVAVASGGAFAAEPVSAGSAPSPIEAVVAVGRPVFGKPTAVSSDGRFVTVFDWTTGNGLFDRIDRRTGAATAAPSAMMSSDGHVFVVDKSSTTIEMVDVDNGSTRDYPVPTGWLNPTGLAVSRHGEVVVFSVDAGGASFHTPAYALITATGETVDLTAGLPRTQFVAGPGGASVSADGRYVTFGWNNINVGCTVSGPQCLLEILRYDMVTRTRQLVSVSAGGAEAAGADQLPATSASGRYVSWLSNATDLTPGLSDARYRLVMRDLDQNLTSLVSDNIDQSTALVAPSIDDEGRLVAFQGTGHILFNGMTFDETQDYVFDRVAGTTTH